MLKQLPCNDVVLQNPFMGIMPEARKGLCYVNDCSTSGHIYLKDTVNDKSIGRRMTVLNDDYSHRGVIEIVSVVSGFHFTIKVISGTRPQKGSYLITWTNPVKLVFALYTWKQLEPVKGVFDFAAIEKLQHLKYWRSQGVHCMLKVASDYPSKIKHTDLPDWLMAEIGNDGTYYNVTEWGNVQGFFPDYTNPILIAAHDRLFKALGAKYNNDDFIYLVEMGSLGYWGEFHGGPLFPKIPIAEQYMTHYKKYFPSKFISCRRNFSTFTKNNSIGYYNDGVKPNGQQVYDWGLTWANNGYIEDGNGNVHPPDPDIITRGPVDGEPIIWNDTQDLFWSDAQYPQMAKDMDALNMNSFHVTPDMVERKCGATLKNWQDFIKRLGYRFYIREIGFEFDSDTNILSVYGSVENKGWSKFWFGWPFEISIVKGSDTIATIITNTDIKAWVLSFTSDVKIDEAGTYKICVAILNPKTGKPSVDFANYGKRTDGRYELAEFTLKEITTTKEVITYVTTRELILQPL